MGVVVLLRGISGFDVWSARTWSSILSADTPTDVPRAHGSGPDPDRVLLFGSDMFLGRGMLSHDLAFPGQFARAVSQTTSRGIDVDLDARPKLLVADALAAVEGIHFDRYDAVLLHFGLADAMAQTTALAWRTSLDALFDHLEFAMSVSGHIFVIESPDPTTDPLFRSGHATKVAKSVRSYNTQTVAAAAGRTTTTVLPFPVTTGSPLPRVDTPSTFARFAQTFAQPVAAHLDLEFRAGSGRSPAISSESDRQRSLENLRILDTVGEERFDRIVASARARFHTQYAAFNLIDGDRRWSKSQIGSGPAESPREHEFCNLTIHQHGALIVGDAQLDTRFAANPLVVGEPHIRFYAGYPIESPDGQRIGTLCVYDPEPRDASVMDAITLRDLAIAIEKELWVDNSDHRRHPLGFEVS